MTKANEVIGCSSFLIYFSSTAPIIKLRSAIFAAWYVLNSCLCLLKRRKAPGSMKGSIAMAFFSASVFSTGGSEFLSSLLVLLRRCLEGFIGVRDVFATSCIRLRGALPRLLGMTKGTSLLALLYSSSDRTSVRCPKSVL